MKQKFIIALGASAGGLSALYEFFDNTLPDGVTYIITTHLYPHQKSMLTELIRRHSVMEVFEVTDNMKIEENHVYVMPENKVMSIKNGMLILDARDLSIKINMAIDIFLNSLADAPGYMKVAVILSGMGKDGTEGTAAISERGGLIIVQDLKDSTEMSMPSSVINAGHADMILHPKEMPKAIIDFVSNFK